MVVWSGVCGAAALNPSFEITYGVLGRPRPVPQYWWRLDHPSFSSYCTDVWSTDGELSAALFSRSGKAFSPGNRQSFFQLVDLTDIGSIVFDVGLTASAGAFDHFEASVLIDGIPVWRQDTEGLYYDQQVNVSGLSDWHYVELRLTALDAGVFDQGYWTLWDNVRFVEGPTIISAGIDLDPDTLNPRSNGRWITCYIELAEGYDVAQIDGEMVWLGDIPACVDTHGWAAPEAHEGNIMDHDGDGILERMVKFDRQEVLDALRLSQAPLTVWGCLADDTFFEGPAVL